jgi:nitroimidazol reductase NimA-like FMN-containing flavoprotein (pyridoxamine 5'-phosphate oxidase superfamily)
MTASRPTERTRVRRKPDRGSYDRDTINRILDEALICHIGFVVDGQPYVVPTVHAREGEQLYFHGSPANRMLNTLAEGVACCVTVTQVDGVILARSARKHSLNYRSVMVLGVATEVTDPELKISALRCIVEHMVPGRTADVGEASERDLSSTSVLTLPIHEASAKVREGGPSDSADEHTGHIWAGQLPLALTPSAPIPDTPAGEEVTVPDYLEQWRTGLRSQPGD